MSTVILNLPQEIYTLIIDKLSLYDLARLSATSRLHREHLAPRVFRIIEFGNDAKTSGSALAAIFRIPVMRGSSDREHYPPATRELLLGCATPKAGVFRFTFDFDSYVACGRSKESNMSDFYWTVEHPAETTEAEQRCTWRAVLNETYRAIAKNTAIKNIVFNGLVPISVSALYTRRFGELLGRLKSVSIWIPPPCDPDTDPKLVQVAGYKDFISKMPKVFFSRMSQLDFLIFRTHYESPMGGMAPTAIKFPLAPEHLPNLQYLTLGNSFICPELVEFLKSHANTLASVRLVDCMSEYRAAAQGGYPEPSETWAQFFSQITDLQPPALVSLCIEYYYDALLEIHDEDQFVEAKDKNAEMIEVKRLQSSLAKDPERRVFAYAGFDESMFLLLNAFVTREQATKLEDYYEYQRLMKFVENNSRRKARDKK